MTRRFWAMLLIAAAAAPAVPALAQGVVAPAELAVPTASVLVAGRQVALLGPAGGLTPAQRAQRLRNALVRALGPGGAAVRADDVHVRLVDRVPVVAVRGVPVVSATHVDARLTGLTARETAERWAGAFRAALAGGRAEVAIVPGSAVFHGGGAGSGAVVR